MGRAVRPERTPSARGRGSQAALAAAVLAQSRDALSRDVLSADAQNPDVQSKTGLHDQSHVGTASITLGLLAAAWSALGGSPSSAVLLDGITEHAGLPRSTGIEATPALLDAIWRFRAQAWAIGLCDSFALALTLEHVYEALLLHGAAASGSTRTRLGAVYTPSPLALRLTREAWSRLTPPSRVLVLDPSCGSGRFLLASVDAALGANAPAPLLHGFDIDPCAIFITRALLCTHPRLFGDQDTVSARIRCCDALSLPPRADFDLVLGNPPFLNQLERASARASNQARELASMTRGVIRGYADTAGAFLHRAISLTRPGGVICMIQPLSVLAARDSRPLRAWSSRTATLESLWVGDTHAFAASVHACALTLRRLGPSTNRATANPTAHAIGLSRGIPPRTIARVRATPTTRWSVLAARACGVPNLHLDPHLPTLRTWLEATADFRDVYYALRELIIESPANGADTLVPILNTGLIELAATSWGKRPARMYRERWQHPAFDLTRAQQHPFLARVLPHRLRPKIILATQTRVIEAFVDPRGTWMPTTPLISLTPRPHAPDLFTIAAALCSPVGTLVAARRTFGTSMSPRAIKLAAREVLDLPVPREPASLVPAAHAFREAAAAHAQQNAPAYHAAVDAFAIHSIAAFSLPVADQARILAWWQSRRATGTSRRPGASG